MDYYCGLAPVVGFAVSFFSCSVPKGLYGINLTIKTLIPPLFGFFEGAQ
jgi:hypothetical protein